ncbi:MAG: LPS export ABC transporter periplasmic protein LptC [Synechococcaceae cyanobacterium]|nr:LPS export ABC transporter periplasmic protein LptC [Synechococcaceae cyanobacterium]
MKPLHRCGGVVVVGLLLLTGCQPRSKPDREASAPPFVFRSLDLRQQDAQGRRLWEISSSEARYDLRRKLAQATDLRGTIYLEGQPRYRVMASSGVVINDGEVVQLEGTIRLEQIDDPPTLITASRVRWLPSRQLMELDRFPSAYNDRFAIRGRTATFRIDKERLELRGQPSLRGWSQPFNPLRRLPDRSPELALQARDVVWYPRSGKLLASGPVQGRRRAQPERAPGPPNQGPGRTTTATLPAGPGSQLLNAGGLEGNTTEQTFRLLAPMRLYDTSQNTTLLAPGLTVDLRRAVATTVAGPQGCRILRPGETLQARRCQWNWAQQSAQAEGDVVLRRRDNDQSSQAGRLDARLGPSGAVVLTAPGARVISRFRVPLPQEPARPAPSARQEPEPIHL